MRLLLLAGLAAGAWLWIRRRRGSPGRVVVGWTDGSELELGAGPGRDRLLVIARGAFA